MYLVTRIAGPRGVDRALDQIDQALYADKYFYPAPGYYQGPNPYFDPAPSFDGDRTGFSHGTYQTEERLFNC
jgi:hypothetical protein